jgi:NADH-quinone oxidoreductase subunit A
MEQYLPIVLMLALAAAFAAGSFVASKVLGPLRPTAAKQGPYESGIVPRRAPASRFPVRFYLVAMIFIIFDIEVVFLYPWAVMYHQLSTFGLAEMGTFAAIVFVSFAYLVSNGALDWGPAQRLHNKPSLDLTRTATSTVRRVPRPAQVAVDGPGLLTVDDGDRLGDGPAQAEMAEAGDEGIRADSHGGRDAPVAVAAGADDERRDA